VSTATLARRGKMNTHDKLKEIVQAAIDGSNSFLDWEVYKENYQLSVHSAKISSLIVTLIYYRGISCNGNKIDPRKICFSANDFILTPNAMKAVFGDDNICHYLLNDITPKMYKKNVDCFIAHQAGYRCELCEFCTPAWRHHTITACKAILGDGIEAAIDYLYDEMIRRDI
jgi:hypothetical protein